MRMFVFSKTDTSKSDKGTCVALAVMRGAVAVDVDFSIIGNIFAVFAVVDEGGASGVLTVRHQQV